MVTEKKIDVPENEFGPWMLVTRRRDHGGGRGGAGGSRQLESREAHASSRAPNGKVTNTTAIRSDIVRSPRGGLSRGRDSHVSSRPQKPLE